MAQDIVWTAVASAKLGAALSDTRVRDRGSAVRGVADVLTPDTVLFGASIPGETERHSAAGRAALRGLNHEGIFDNRTDTEEGLRETLTGAFHDVTIDVIRSAAVFTARLPRRPLRPSSSS